MISESEFETLADETMVAIEEAIDASGADIDYDSGGGILTLEFVNGSRIIVNKQAPLKQLWVAARSGGLHFDYDPDSGAWRKDDDGEELFVVLSQCCSEQAGEPVALEP